VQQDPAVASISGFIGSGGGGGGSTNSGSLYISLKPLSHRKLNANAVIERLRKALSSVSGATLYLQAAQDLSIGGRAGTSQFQYTLSADSLTVLNEVLPKIMTTLKQVPGIADVNSDQRTNGLQQIVVIDHATAAYYHLNTQQIDNTLYDAFGQRQVSTLYKSMNQYHVIMEVAPPFLQYPSTLQHIYVANNLGALIPLSAFAHFETQAALITVNHQNQFPATTLYFNLLPGTALGDAVDKISNAIDDLHLPPTVQGAFQGTAKAYQASLTTTPFLILAALLAVYIVLGILYESTVHPITILSTLPSAGVGALLALLITHTEFSLIALIGIILLIGIVKKNAIMMIDFALQVERTQQKSSYDAIFEAAVMRFRPIMMTTLAALFGALPLALGTGMGAEIRRPLGITIVGGLIVSQLLTLYTTPVIYLTLERIKQWAKPFHAIYGKIS